MQTGIKAVYFKVIMDDVDFNVYFGVPVEKR